MAQRIYAESLTRAERHRISDALYRMRKEGFIIPTDEYLSIVGNIKDASTYATIRKQVVANENVTFRAVRGKGRAKGEVSGKLAEEYIQKSKEWNKQRRKAGKLARATAPEYKVAGVGPSPLQTQYMTEKQVNKEFEKAFRKQIKRMETMTPSQYANERIEMARENALKSIDTAVLSSPQIKQMLEQGINRMGDYELYNFLKNHPDMTAPLYGSDQEKLLLGGTSGVAPVISILDAMGYDINQQSADSPRDESIADYVEQVNLFGGNL